MLSALLRAGRSLTAGLPCLSTTDSILMSYQKLRQARRRPREGRGLGVPGSSGKRDQAGLPAQARTCSLACVARETELTLPIGANKRWQHNPKIQDFTKTLRNFYASFTAPL